MKVVFYIFGIIAIAMFALAQENTRPSQEKTTPPQEITTPPPHVYPVALPNYDEETATRLQIFLDNSDFGPGKIDGRMGEFFRKALVAYKVAHGIPPTGAVDRFLAEVPTP